MKEQIFKRYKALLEERLDKIELVNIGEDSIRYDFFIALSEIENLNPSDLQLEYPIHEKAFNKRMNHRSKRNEKPQLDMMISRGDLKMSFEFALFRQNSNKEGSINKTGRTTKMLNDMIRLALDSYYTKRDAYFICVADDKMLGHQLRSKIIERFPSNYEITKSLIEKHKEIKTSKFDDRFTSVFNKLNFNIISEIIFNTEIQAKKIERKTRVLIWRIIIINC